jgi:uncharacterized protein (TIGR00369 family)
MYALKPSHGPKMQFEPKDPNFEQRVRADFARQRAMQSLGIDLVRVGPGEVDLAMPFAEAYAQQHGFIHAGIITTALDSACGYAAFSLMPIAAEVLTVEFKTNLLAPAQGECFVFRAHVIKPGRTLTVCEGRAFAQRPNADDRLIATMSATMMTVVGHRAIVR